MRALVIVFILPPKHHIEPKNTPVFSALVECRFSVIRTGKSKVQHWRQRNLCRKNSMGST